MSSELNILLANIAACGQRIEKLTYSLNKNREIFPITLARAEALTDEQEESIDALILRYSQCVSMIQDQIFRGIAYVEQEDLSDKSNRDKARLMEKLGAIQSADDFGTAAILRNKFSHHYPEEADLRIERLNLVVAEADYVIATFADIMTFIARKGFLSNGNSV
ncbi:MAG: hypothetical protein KJ558_11090 [Gammaproteobacteria bacterium]|nr:hypothetical protein [Gammaproteobacteria bacterium]MBU1655351.1 hypothetical protein [Gammaproteobacteria bacterium]MBU1960534.1 hypothetical protein [Gammaproteobacteria bacterium]